MGKNIGFIATRFAGIDGVTMEAGKWANVLRQSGHRCFCFAGMLERAPPRSFLAPEAFFGGGQEQVFGKKKRDPAVTRTILSRKTLIKEKLLEFIPAFAIDLIIPQNALTIPMHIPLGLALTELIAEVQIPTIAHHHDFYWEHTRFSVNAVNDYLRMAFPPNPPNMEHVVINSAAREELALRTGVCSIT